VISFAVDRCKLLKCFFEWVAQMENLAVIIYIRVVPVRKFGINAVESAVEFFWCDICGTTPVAWKNVRCVVSAPGFFRLRHPHSQGLGIPGRKDRSSLWDLLISSEGFLLQCAFSKSLQSIVQGRLDFNSGIL